MLVVVLLLGAAGCATTNGGDPRDPYEGFNRSMYSFNEGFDEAIGKPVATAYRDVVPGPLRMMVRNFFSNIADLWIGGNNLLQGKPLDAITDWTRFAFNSTFGIVGILDFASEIGLEKHDEDFGQTFGRWGIDDGPYFVWPFLGPSTLRDTGGTVLDFYVDPVLNHKPVRVRNVMTALRLVSKRADLLDASRILEEAALDKYVFQRDAYLQRRRSLINDGNVPRAEREAPRADEEDAPRVEQQRSEPPPGQGAPAQTQPAAASVDAAVQMLEEPAVGAGRGG